MQTELEDIIGNSQDNFYFPFSKRALTMDFLANNSLEKFIPVLEDLGIILRREVGSNDRFRSGYVRHLVGNGVSDDLAVIVAGVKYGMDAAIGVYLIDAIDTLDKYVPVIYPGGMDERLGKIILSKVPGLISEDEITSFIRAIWNSKEQIADSSQRRFLEIQYPVGVSAIEAHREFIRTGKPISGLLFGFDRIPSEEFYRNAQLRLDQVEKIYKTG